MTEKRKIMLQGNQYHITVSDEQAALWKAYASGDAVIALYRPDIPGQQLAPAQFAVEDIEDADGILEIAVCRRFNIPYVISRTERLIIRELSVEDSAAMVLRGETSASFVHSRFKSRGCSGSLSGKDVLFSPQGLEAYIRCQYSFYEYGIWGLEEKKSGALIGIAGVDGLAGEGLEGLELGYEVFANWQKQGYGLEACRAIIQLVKEKWPHEMLFARMQRENLPSLRLLKRLGFDLIKNPAENEETLCWFQYGQIGQ